MTLLGLQEWNGVLYGHRGVGFEAAMRFEAIASRTREKGQSVFFFTLYFFLTLSSGFWNQRSGRCPKES